MTYFHRLFRTIDGVLVIGFPTQKNDNLSIIITKNIHWIILGGCCCGSVFAVFSISVFFQSILFKYCKYLLPVFVVWLVTPSGCRRCEPESRSSSIQIQNDVVWCGRVVCGVWLWYVVSSVWEVGVGGTSIFLDPARALNVVFVNLVIFDMRKDPSAAFL